MLVKFLDGTSREVILKPYADLRGADLSGADLSGADLRGADLRGADLRSADLRSADLRGALLSGADLRGAILSDAILSDAILPKNYRIGRLDFGGWPVTVTPTETSIGCQRHANAAWLNADPSWIASMDSNAAEWWARHGATVRALILDIQAP